MDLFDIVLQWKSVQQDFQAEKEYPRGHAPVRPDAARGRNSRLRQPAACRDATRGRGSERMGRCQQFVLQQFTIHFPSDHYRFCN